MSTTTIDRPRTRQPESPDDRDPMEQYYGRSAWDVADELFGEDWTKAGEFYSTPDQDIPYHVTSDGTGANGLTSVNMITNQPSGVDGISRSTVISQGEAERLARLTPQHKLHVPARFYQ